VYLLKSEYYLLPFFLVLAAFLAGVALATSASTSRKSIDRTVETSDKTTAPKIAAQKLSNLNSSPGTAATISKTMAFTTKVNSPKVKKFKGAVRKSKIGLIKVLIIPKTIAANSAVVKPLTWNPGTR